jgi:dipeptidase E
MRLYLSSFRLTQHHEHLLQLAGHGRRTALVPNALDNISAEDRSEGLRRDLDELEAAGLAVEMLDLRHTGAVDRLAGFNVVWVRGGNIFVLRRALADTGADTVLIDLLQRDAIVYGGYSAGPCVLGSDLTALADVDDITAVDDPITDGLGVLDRPFVPHVQSPAHPESAACDAIAACYKAQGQRHWALSDGQVLLVEGDKVTVL